MVDMLTCHLQLQLKVKIKTMSFLDDFPLYFQLSLQHLYTSYFYTSYLTHSFIDACEFALELKENLLRALRKLGVKIATEMRHKPSLNTIGIGITLVIISLLEFYLI